MRSAMVLAALLLIGPTVAQAVPVRAIPGLVSVTFYERTGGVAPNAFTFAVDSSQLTTRLPDPLGGSANFDIAGASTEYYDVFFSNGDGTFNLDGEYLSIEGVFLQTLPAGGGLNLVGSGERLRDDPGVRVFQRTAAHAGARTRHACAAGAWPRGSWPEQATTRGIDSTGARSAYVRQRQTARN